MWKREGGREEEQGRGCGVIEVVVVVGFLGLGRNYFVFVLCWWVC